MVKNTLPCVEINPPQPPKASVIWMHGLGADGYDFAPVIPELNLPHDFPIRFVFPHAPLRSVTINAGYTMRAWYDIVGTDFNAREDEAGVKDSQTKINQLIAKEESLGIPSQNIILAGFSQGGAMALYCGLCYPEPLGGIIALSTYLPLSHKFMQEANAVNKNTAIFMAHGTDDPILPLAWGQTSADFLKNQGYPLEFHSYPMPHSVCNEEIKAIGLWLRRRLGSVTESF